MRKVLILCGVTLTWGVVAPVHAQSTVSGRERTQQLIARIRVRMSEIDQLLLSRKPTGSRLKENDQDIEALIGEAQSKSDSVISAIDELLAFHT